MQSYRPLFISLIVGIIILVVLGMLSECNDSNTASGSTMQIANTDELVKSVNACSNQPWNKPVYDSLSTLIQMSSNFSETVKQNLKETLDGYYLHSMKITFDEWKKNGCSDSMGIDIKVLVQSIKLGITDHPGSIYNGELNTCITEFNEINQVAGIRASVLSFIKGKFDNTRFVSLKNSIETLRMKSHVMSCSNNAQILDEQSIELQSFFDLVQNVDRFLGRRTNNFTRVMLQSNGFDLSKYPYYDSLLQ